MLTRNFYQIFLGNRTGSNSGAPNVPYYESEFNAKPTLYCAIKNPTGKIYLGDTPENTDKFIQVGSGNFSSTRKFLPKFKTGTSDNYPLSTTMASTLSVDKDATSTTAITDQYTFQDGIPMIFFGSGTQAEDIDDNTLQTYVTTYNRSLCSITIDMVNCTITTSMVFTPTEDMTVNEIGLFATQDLYSSGVNASLSNTTAMIARKVLDTPATFKAGIQYTIDYAIDFLNGADRVV